MISLRFSILWICCNCSGRDKLRGPRLREVKWLQNQALNCHGGNGDKPKKLFQKKAVVTPLWPVQTWLLCQQRQAQTPEFLLSLLPNEGLSPPGQGLSYDDKSCSYHRPRRPRSHLSLPVPRSHSFLPASPSLSYSPPVLSLLDAELPFKSIRRFLLRNKSVSIEDVGGKGLGQGPGVLHPLLSTLTADQSSGRSAELKRSNAKDRKSVSS